MDNMLYIVAGLVIILLIAVLIMRRQNSQPAIRSSAEIKKQKRAPDDYEAARTSAASSAGTTKFDSLTIAERFMDQQRYDKAIETLERGLIQQPHDAALSLKLLNIYAITTQPESFYRTYDAISAHGDAATIAQAQQLKDLFDQEHNQSAPLLARDNVNHSQEVHPTKSGYDSLDFDVASVPDDLQNQSQKDSFRDFQQTISSAGPSDEPRASASPQDSASSDAIFDLTLDDLERDSFEDGINDNSAADTPSINTASALDSDDALSLEGQPSTDTTTFDDSTLDSSTLSIKPSKSFDDISNISEDFSLDFDEPVAPHASSNDAVDFESDAAQASPNLAEDFVLDFDDLTADTNTNNETAPTDRFVQNDLSLADNPEIDSTGFDFDFSLEDDKSESAGQDSLSLAGPDIQDSSNSLNTSNKVAAANAPAVEESLADDITSDFNDSLTLDSDSFDFDLTTPQTDATQSATATSPDSALVFDDNTPIDEVFSFDDASFDDMGLEEAAATTAEPVIIDEIADEPDFASKFAADFDFVNELDNHQITLDLAAKYLELGEYDSAKRLLSEVIAQGSSEQRTQAQALLERTV